MNDIKELIIGSIISAIISIVVTEFFGWLSITTVLLILFLITLICIICLIKIVLRFYSIFSRINVGSKEYYDIMTDIVHYSKNKSRNNQVVFNELEWIFKCKENPTTNEYLDIEEYWEIEFAAHSYDVRELVLGIRGGDPANLNIDDMVVKQNGLQLQSQPHLQENETGYRFELDSTVKKKENCTFDLTFKWPKFIAVDRHDDYFFLMPKSQAKEIKSFKVTIEHPYNCEATVYLFTKGVWGYSRQRITGEETCRKHSIKMENNNNIFKFKMDNPAHMDVVLIVFDRKA